MQAFNIQSEIELSKNKVQMTCVYKKNGEKAVEISNNEDNSYHGKSIVFVVKMIKNLAKVPSMNKYG